MRPLDGDDRLPELRATDLLSLDRELLGESADNI